MYKQILIIEIYTRLGGVYFIIVTVTSSKAFNDCKQQESDIDSKNPSNQHFSLK